MSRLAHYRESLGFDRAKHIPFTRLYSIKCSACAALVINSIPAHETGCPNATVECNGCNERIPANHRYCGDCR